MPDTPKSLSPAQITLLSSGPLHPNGSQGQSYLQPAGPGGHSLSFPKTFFSPASITTFLATGRTSNTEVNREML